MESTYRTDANVPHRIAAVAALHAVGDEGGLQQLWKGIALQESAFVQHTAIAALMDCYGPDTFKGSEDMVAIAEDILDAFEAERQSPPFITTEN